MKIYTTHLSKILNNYYVIKLSKLYMYEFASVKSIGNCKGTVAINPIFILFNGNYYLNNHLKKK